MLKFLNKFNFKFVFKSSTENYKIIIFNDSLIRISEKYEDDEYYLTYSGRKEETYCPFLPICPETESFRDFIIRNG